MVAEGSVQPRPSNDAEAPKRRTVKLGGLETIIATRREFAEMMLADCRAARASDTAPLPKLVFSSNGQGVSLVGTDPDFAAAMGGADMIHADGMPVVYASRFFTRTPLPERIATTDFFHDAAGVAIESGLSFYMMGGTEAQNIAACAAIAELYPKLKVAGRRNGYFKPEEDAQICREVVASGADVLWVALGKPKQEYWSVRNRENLRGIGWVKTCGGLFDFLGGGVSRAPDWVQKMALEWAWRTLQEPRRLGWRYLVTNPHALYCLARKSG
jgi:N-acetylglucosaminyldiphosphoundecaprenol N-acetyl-beta-D-mannosaminyltransferase